MSAIVCNQMLLPTVYKLEQPQRKNSPKCRQDLGIGVSALRMRCLSLCAVGPQRPTKHWYPQYLRLIYEWLKVASGAMRTLSMAICTSITTDASGNILISFFRSIHHVYVVGLLSEVTCVYTRHLLWYSHVDDMTVYTIYLPFPLRYFLIILAIYIGNS